jgi:hypothetical protein
VYGELASKCSVLGFSGALEGAELGRDHRTRPEVNNEIVTEITAQVLREVYVALVLGCKMEIPASTPAFMRL